MSPEAKELKDKIFEEWNETYPDLERISLIIDQVYDQGYIDGSDESQEWRQ